MNSAAQPQPKIRFRGRSFIAFTLAPAAPVADWLTELDESVSKSPDFFQGRPVMLDLAAVKLSEFAVTHLLDQLAKRGIRIMGIEGADPATLSDKLPPVLSGGWPVGEEKRPVLAVTPNAPPSKPSPSRQKPASLLFENPIRSGQSVDFPFGDVTVLGSVASGAEVVAGGSIHVYGALRGRAMAGSLGDARARIFCSRNEAELLAINGCYRTAEDMAEELRSRPTQAWLDGARVMITALA